MVWRTVEHQWPNGRRYWTIENAKTREVRIGHGNQPSKYHDHAIAFTEADRLNQKAETTRKPVLKPEDDDFDVIED